MKDNITIHDIARLMNVSPSTVSRALNDNPRISLSTRKAIQDLARKHGYRPNTIASSLRLGTSTTVGVIVPRISRFFFSSVIGSLEERMNEAGYNVMICQTQEDHQKEVESIKTLLNMRVDTIFISLSTGSTTTGHIREIIDRGIKVLMFDRVDDSLPAPAVKLDDRKGAYESVNHMIKQGYRKIAHFAGPDHIRVYRERKEGYLDALRDQGLPVKKEMIFPDTITRERGYRVLLDMIDSGNLPDAIFSASDFSALGALLAAREKNISIPQDCGIAGFANEPFTEFVQPGITSIDQKPDEMGTLMAKIFLENTGKDHAQREILSPQLIIRNSTLRS